jgi:hypothetical protein
MNDTYTRLRRLSDILQQIDIEAVQGQLDLQPSPWVYVPREVAPTAANQDLPAFVKIQAE